MYESINNTVKDLGISLPQAYMNTDGEVVILSQGETDGLHFYKMVIYQNNGWIRTNIYYADGTSEELFDGSERLAYIQEDTNG